MLVRKSTLSFVVVGATVFLIGSSFLVWTRPEYTRDVIPAKWKDWTGLGSSSDRPLPIDESSPSGSPSSHNTPAAPDGDTLHILPFPSHDEVDVKPLPVGLDTQLQPILVASHELQVRLRALLSGPVMTYAESVEASAKTCPRDVADRQVNPDQLSGQTEMWATVGGDELVRRRIAMVKYLEDLEKSGKVIIGEKGKTGTGRGIEEFSL